MKDYTKVVGLDVSKDPIHDAKEDLQRARLRLGIAPTRAGR